MFKFIYKPKQKPEQKKAEFNFNDVRIIQEIGSGHYATVYKAELGANLYAVKQLNCRSRKQIESFNEEVRIHNELVHENIVKLFGADIDRLLICMEYVPRGTLWNKIEENKTGVQWLTHGVFIARDISRALKFLKEKKVVHSDIKPENILMLDDRRVKVADFGLSAIIVNENYSRNCERGTPLYMAPENLLGYRNSFASDMYSAGMTFWVMENGKKPWSGIKDIFQLSNKLTYGLRPELSNTTKEARRYIQKMWQHRSEDRINADDLNENLEKRTQQLQLS